MPGKNQNILDSKSPDFKYCIVNNSFVIHTTRTNLNSFLLKHAQVKMFFKVLCLKFGNFCFVLFC